MLSALFWVLLFTAVVVAAASLRKRVRGEERLQTWYERVVKNRVGLIKKIVIYGTLILWAAIWLATRGEDKAGIGSLLRDFSSSWSKQEPQVPPSAKKE